MTLAVRDTAAGRAAAAGIAASTGRPAPLVGHLDLADQNSVRAFADQWRGPLHILETKGRSLQEIERELTGTTDLSEASA